MADAATVAREITAKLCSDEGLTPDTLAQCPALREILESSDLAEAALKLVETIQQLSDNVPGGALLNALGLDSSAPDSLIGPYGRRAAYARKHSTREDIVRAWEEQAVQALANMLTARSSQHIEEISIVFFVEDKKILYKSETRFWVDKPPKPGMPIYNTNVRVETRNIQNEGGMHLAAGLYQLQAEERPSALDVYLVFPDNQLPDIAFSIHAEDIFALTTGTSERRDLGRPHAAVSLLGDELEPDGGKPVFGEMSGYTYRIEKPHQSSIYGIGWLYG